MPELTYEKLFHTDVPESWGPLLETLADIESVTHDETTPEDTRRDELIALRKRLLAQVSEFEGSLPLEHAKPSDLVRHFCEAVLMWTLYARSGARVIFATTESTTLPHFPLDLPDDSAMTEAVRDGLSRAFSIPRSELDAWQRDLEHQASNLDLKRAIVEVLVAQLKDASDPSAAVLELYQNIYGAWPFRSGDIRFFAAEGCLVFTAPYQDGRLTLPDFATRPAADRTMLESYIRRVEAGSWKTDRFPGFGELDPTALNPDFLRELTYTLSARTDLPDLSDAVVRETLHTMVTFLSSYDAEGYLIHDLWGHTWQETLAEFEWDYYRLESVVRTPIGPDTGAFDAHGERIAPGLIEAFRVDGERVRLDEDTALAALKRELRVRVRLSLNAVVAEALADVTEYKYTHGERAGGEALPSSSLLYDSPVKHDLTSRDILFHYRRWRKSFIELIDDVAVRGRLSGVLINRLGIRSGVRESVDQLAELMRLELEATALSPRRTSCASEGVIPIDIVQRTQAAAARLDRDLVDYIDRGTEELARLRQETPDLPRWQCPIACLDLLVLVLGWFFERDRDVLFWHLDELVREELPPLMDALGRALRG